MNTVNKAVQEYTDAVSEDVRVFTLSLIQMMKENNIQVLKDNEVVSYKTLESAADKLSKDIKEIPKQRKKFIKELYPKRNGGFANPIFITKNMHEFLLEADLGICYDQDGNNIGQLKDKLTSLIEFGVTTTGILTSIFSIYRQLTRNYDPNDKNYTVPTDLMIKYFSKEFSLIEEEDSNDDKRKDKFRRDRFRTARLRTLFTHCTDKDVTEEEKNEANTMLDSLKEEQQHAKNTLAHLHRLNA